MLVVVQSLSCCQYIGLWLAPTVQMGLALVDFPRAGQDSGDNPIVKLEGFADVKERDIKSNQCDQSQPGAAEFAQSGNGTHANWIDDSSSAAVLMSEVVGH